MTSRRLTPRDQLPHVDRSETPTWWAGWWAAAPLWAVIGAALAVIVLKR